MNSQQVFEAIGYIDDDFILEANEEKKSHKKMYQSMVAIAAAIVVMFSLSIFQQTENELIFNTMRFVNAKEIPIDLSGYEVETLTLEGVKTYLSEITIPETYPLISLEAKLAYDDQLVVYDEFKLDYLVDEGSMTITTTKIDQNKRSLFIVGDGVKVSTLKEYDVYLGKAEDTLSHETIFYGEVEVNDIFITFKSRGITESDFIKIIESILKD